MRLGLAMVDSLKEFESRMRSSSVYFMSTHMSSSAHAVTLTEETQLGNGYVRGFNFPRETHTFAREEMRYPKALQMKTGPFERKLGVKVKHKYFGQDECHKVLDNTF